MNAGQLTDYVNANYVAGHLGEQTYIATQAPLVTTFPSFWHVILFVSSTGLLTFASRRMIWEHKVEIIAMVTNEREGGSLKVCVFDSHHVEYVFKHKKMCFISTLFRQLTFDCL